MIQTPFRLNVIILPQAPNSLNAGHLRWEDDPLRFNYIWTSTVYRRCRTGGCWLDLTIRSLPQISTTRKNWYSTFKVNSITFPPHLHIPRRIPLLPLLFGVTWPNNMSSWSPMASQQICLGTHGCDTTIHSHWTWPWGSVKLESPGPKGNGYRIGGSPGFLWSPTGYYSIDTKEFLKTT